MELVAPSYQYMSRESVFIATGLTASYDRVTPAPLNREPLLVTNRSCCGGLTPTYSMNVHTCICHVHVCTKRNVFVCAHIFLKITNTILAYITYMYMYTGIWGSSPTVACQLTHIEHNHVHVYTWAHNVCTAYVHCMHIYMHVCTNV